MKMYLDFILAAINVFTLYLIYWPAICEKFGEKVKVIKTISSFINGQTMRLVDKINLFFIIQIMSWHRWWFNLMCKRIDSTTFKVTCLVQGQLVELYVSNRESNSILDIQSIDGKSWLKEIKPYLRYKQVDWHKFDTKLPDELIVHSTDGSSKILIRNGED